MTRADFLLRLVTLPKPIYSSSVQRLGLMDSALRRSAVLRSAVSSRGEALRVDKTSSFVYACRVQWAGKDREKGL